MTSTVAMAMWSAALLAMVSALFGVCAARLIWAEDLKFAQQIDEIRSGTEKALRSQIASLEQQVKTLRSDSP